MATIKVCDFCKGHPNDYDAKSGGDVRTVVLEIKGVETGNTGSPAERRRFDACAPCRTRLFGDVLDNIAASLAEPETVSHIEMFKRIAEERDKERAKQPRNIPVPTWPTYPSHPPYWGIYPPMVKGGLSS
jgi:hypothetical protein